MKIVIIFKLDIEIKYAPCSHEGPCLLNDNCFCKERGFCEVYCQCGGTNCIYGCTCTNCTDKCLCQRYNRSCTYKCGCVNNAFSKCRSTKMSPKLLAISESNIPNAGIGVFAMEDIEENQYITEYLGEHFDEETLENDEEIEMYDEKFTFTLNSSVIVIKLANN